MRVGKALAVFGAIFALLMTGCDVEGGQYSTAFRIVMRDFSFEGVPKVIRGGVVRANFVNEGTVGHEMAMIQIGNKSLDQFKADFGKLLQGGPFASYMRSGAQPFVGEPGENRTSTFRLSEGTYAMFCAESGDPAKPRGPEGEEGQGAPHYERGMLQTVVVEGTGGELTAPDGEIAAKDYTFEIPDIGAGKHQLVFRNKGPMQWHHMVALEAPKGVTEKQAKDAFLAFAQADQTGQPPPPGLPELADAAYGGVASPGGGQTIEFTFKEGRAYLLACFISDLKGGPPHAVAHNMIKTFTVRSEA